MWKQIRLVQQNGEVLEKPLHRVMLIDRTRIKLYKGRKTIAKEEYTSIIQVIILKSYHVISSTSDKCTIKSLRSCSLLILTYVFPAPIYSIIATETQCS